MLHEMPLVIFTIAAQMSAGSFIVLGLIHLFGAKAPQAVMDRVTDPALYAIGPLLVLGLAASTFHLGSPMRAANALRHIGTSWLSMEILAGLLFAALGFLFAAMQWFKWGSHRLRQVLAMLTAAVGIFLVFCISKVYSLRTVPAWATWHTPVRFFITTFLLGGLAVAAALVIAAYVRRSRGNEYTDEEGSLLLNSVRGIALGSLLAAGLKFITMPAYLGYLGSHENSAAQRSLTALTDTYGGWQMTQSVLLFAGVATLGVLLFRAASDRGRKVLPLLAVTAFVLVLAAEFIGRMLFYASMVRTGL